MYFSFDEPELILEYVRRTDLLPGVDSSTVVERPGQGNMNFVARIRAGDDSIILKQSRPWVEKYPSIDAPADRILTEVAFYRAVSRCPDLQNRMPRLIHHDPDRLVAVFEDLGDASDYTTLYTGAHANAAPDLRVLLGWLSALHDRQPDPDENRLANREMRALNHAHIFEIPLRSDNGLDLESITPGLGAAAARLQSDRAYLDAVSELGRIYLLDGDTLLHGDFYPGSWVRSADGPKVIDPEFGFHGCPEFDLGVCRAHLFLAGLTTDSIDDLSAGDAADIDRSLVDGFAGAEIMRRLIGVAQLPLEAGAAEKEVLLSLSRKLILGQGF